MWRGQMSKFLLVALSRMWHVAADFLFYRESITTMVLDKNNYNFHLNNVYLQMILIGIMH